MSKVGTANRAEPGIRSHCPQCQKMFLHPRILPCLHSLCGSCLQKLEPFSALGKGQQLGTHKSVLCPVCDSEVALPPGGIEELLPDLLAEGEVLLEQLKSEGHEVACDLCGEGKAERRCQDCRVNVCEFCCQAHRRQKRTAGHTLLPLHDLPAGSLLSPVPCCTLHPLEELSLFCETCTLTTCRDCALTKHRGHVLRPAAEAAGSHREQLSRTLKETEPQVVELEAALLRVDEAGEALRHRSEVLQEEVEQFIERYLSAIQEHRARLMRDIEEEVRRREHVLSLHGARIQQQLLDLHTATGFTRGLLEHGSDLHLLNAQGLALNRLKKLSQGEVKTQDPEGATGIRFSPWKEAGLCHGYQMYGVVKESCADPERSEVSGEGLQSASQGQPCSFTLTYKDTSGQLLGHGGQPPRVSILHKASERPLQSLVQDNHDGTYRISYQPTEPGHLSISVCVRGRRIQGSPFSVAVKGKSHQHPGIYHCCTFCSSGGQKDARCGCGGTMPGGYQGCGHGHRGHPGHSHWSCCGSTMEKSECGGVKDTAPRNLLRTVAL